ncbi:MAG TPA: S8 family peptidase [Kofleriaceae bacterium]|nr:S8 family peptidase [Kofleriaceae bacterium]
MVAVKLRSPWTSLIALACATVVGWLAGGGARDRGVPRELLAPRIHVHVKLRAEGTRLALGRAAASGPLFSHLPPGTHDDRARWLDVVVPAPDGPDRALAELLASPGIEDASLVPVTTLAGLRGAPADDACPIATPSFESYQGYLGPAPHGIDAPAAWRRGLRGQGVWFADIEGGWNPQHEDLPGDRITHVSGQLIQEPTWRAHGTAVLGEVVGRDNGRGVVGIAPDVERVFTSSIGGVPVADAIDVAAEQLRPGDVLLVELQSSGPRGRWVPVELWPEVFDAIRAATARGVVVIEAAGNGGEDLDHRVYQRAFDRKYRDSGAILVGAGGPPREGFSDRERLEFSNYGGRVDVQGWGRKVATLDYGDLQACAGADRHYTGEFAGTSSASPIVAGAAVILEGAARARGRVLTPGELRALLRQTGTPQAGDTAEAIGPRPDLARALRELR